MSETLTVDQAASLLNCPGSFYRLLAHRGFVPRDGHDLVDARALRRARMKYKWLGLLDERLCRDEARRLDSRFLMPPDHLVDLNGASAAPLWRILEYTWLHGDD